MSALFPQSFKPAAWRGSALVRRSSPLASDLRQSESDDLRRDRRDPPILIVPGLYNSGPQHWQTHWERKLKGAVRVEQSDWLRPNLADWTATLAEAVRRRPGAVLVAHSLGCALVSHLSRITNGRNIGGTLLVAPADVNRDGPNAEFLRDFSPMPLGRLPFPSVTVSSHNDPYVAFGRAQMFAKAWGSTLVDLGYAGHINVEAGYGPWPEGRKYLKALIDRTESSHRPAPADQALPNN